MDELFIGKGECLDDEDRGIYRYSVEECISNFMISDLIACCV